MRRRSSGGGKLKVLTSGGSSSDAFAGAGAATSSRVKGQDELAVEAFVGKQNEERERRSKQVRETHLAAVCIQKSFRGRIGFLRFQCAKYERQLALEWDLLKVFKLLLERQKKMAKSVPAVDAVVGEVDASLLEMRKSVSTFKVDPVEAKDAKVRHGLSSASGSRFCGKQRER